GERGRHAGHVAAVQQPAGGRVHRVRPLRPGDRRVVILFCSKLHAIILVAICSAAPRARCRAAVSGDRPSVHDRPRAHRIGRLPGRRDRQRHRAKPLRAGAPGGQFSGIPSVQAPEIMTDRFEPKLALASTLPSRFYNDASVLPAENRSIFARTWQLAGHEDAVRERGRFFTTTVADEPLLIVRGDDGELRVLSNVCRHRAGPVAKGAGQRASLQCGYHGWTYALDGSLRTAPEMDGI